jgi:hypothetical protein
MNHLLDVTGADIARLSDADLRVLTGKLCEADYLQVCLPTRGITWGGHQDAADGGVDVRVRRLTDLDPTNVQPPTNSHIPRSETVFQCKQSNMARRDILAEMSKVDVIQLLGELAASNGAYVIVSGTSTTESMLQNRVGAMRDAVGSITESQRLDLDFYDQSRIASWVQRHPALALWVLERVGRPFSGWRSYGYWASGRGTEDDCYLLDARAKLIPPCSTGHAVDIEEGIRKLRQQLSTQGRAVRLVGHSGVGKTRLVQALFDSRIGTEPLNHYQVYYADGSQPTQPDPIQLADQLIAGGHSALLVIDNCSEQLHRAINQRCCQENSTVRLLTIEYDIKEDIPTETDVYRLQASDDQLIEALISQRYPDVSQIDRATIAAFSEGNTRVALALAESVLHGGSLAGLGDNELFNRLFYQRNAQDIDLLNAAKAASLVYSFSIDDSSTPGSEYAVLAGLYEQTPQTMLRMLSELKRRELLQARGPWRAVLPQAISNRLAKEALEELSLPRVLQAFEPETNHRLLRSFCHRVGFLHEQLIAVQCASDLLSPEGLIGTALLRSEAWQRDVFHRENWEFDCFAFLAPANPEATLRLIETMSDGPDGGHFTSRDNPRFSRVVGLLCKLAYSAELFPRVLAILLRFALNEQPGENVNSIRHQIKPLFQLYLSGTMAPQALRLAVVEDLLDVEDAIPNGLGFHLLEAMLQSSGFISHNSFDFGSRSRDFGYIPATREDVKEWYETALNHCVKLASHDEQRSNEARALFSRQLITLWLNVQLYDLIETIIRDLHARRPWGDGWLAINDAIRIHGSDMDPEAKDRLEKLAMHLAPVDLIESVRLYVCRESYNPYDLLEATPDTEITHESLTNAHLRLEAKAYSLGVEAAQDINQVKQLLPALVNSLSSRITAFIRGLVTSLIDVTWLVEACFTAWREADPSTRTVSILTGVLQQYAPIDRTSYEALLDRLMVDPDFATIFPCIQLGLDIDDQAVGRLIACIESKSAPLQSYRNLGHASVVNRIDHDLLYRLLVVFKDVLLWDHFIVDCLSLLVSLSGTDLLPILFVDFARELLARQVFSFSLPLPPAWDHELGIIAKACLCGEDGAEAARILATNLLAGILDYTVAGYRDYPRLLDTLATCHPTIFLDVFLGSQADHHENISRTFDSSYLHDELGHRYNSLRLIEQEVLFTWCEMDPEHRLVVLAQAVQLFFSTPNNDGPSNLAWTPIALELLSRGPITEGILSAFRDVFFPRAWSGSRAEAIIQRLPLLDTLEQHSCPVVTSWASAMRVELAHCVDGLRERERRQYDLMTQAFE